ncbi:ribonuclease III [Pelodictyon phaeoclathratiforme]|uniref:Ribonuclease 3 n=1 Tax=Pelodictyon phaeoclathratiforme (strain DSM 5477 / BU-1) TaxID=324925 RepID=B4SBB0_PELPB|nr:ribonuclease III [Pelodictyon phaeoclathratiforme]ACF42531.1 Ribonuclease III [Pelodictyon phaeoclathratiforme BU-1]MBV5290230.1 ribonuclease III [Pelodictyon phaeoclathratiforme]
MSALEKFWEKLRSLADLGDGNETNRSSGAVNTSGTETDLSAETVAYLQQLVGEPVSNLPLYQTALTHRSVVHDPATTSLIESNQRLEFLGDSVLGMLISEYLFRKFPTSAEGELSSNRAKIVNSKSLAGFARSLCLGDHLILGESADHHKIRSSESALADAFESLIGAIYLDKGIKTAFDFVIRSIIEHVNFNTIVAAEHNYKSRLIEYTQSNHLPPPLYTVITETGAEHEKSFTVGVSCSGELLGTGTAQRKKDAEQLAAKEAMERIHLTLS